MKIERGLIIDEPWISRLLAGEKTWEMRSTGTQKRGPIALIRKGSGTVVGVGSLIDCKGPLSKREMFANTDKHRIPDHMLQSGKVDKWRWAWILDEVVALDRPVPYQHPKGAVIWVRLEREVALRLPHVGSANLDVAVEDSGCSPAAENHPEPESIPLIGTETVRAMRRGASEELVPFAKDGSWFGRHLGERGYYQVGAKGDEQKIESYEQALDALKKMSTARWRRPNANDNWGIVSAVCWKSIPSAG